MKHNTFGKKSLLVLLSVVMVVCILATAACTNASTNGKIAISMTANKTELFYGETAQLTVAVAGEGDTAYTLSSSNEDLLMVSSSGVVRVVEDVEADTKVTVTATANSDSSVKASVEFTVKAQSEDLPLSISISADKKELEKDGTAKVTVTIANSADKKYTLTSSNPSLLTVSANGDVKVVAEPEDDTVVTITATAHADEEKTATVTIKVKAPIVTKPTITASANKETLAKGDTAIITVEVGNNVDIAFELESDNEDVLTVTPQGLVTAVGDIKVDTIVKVTAKAHADNTVTATVVFTVKAPVIEGQVGELTAEMIEKIGNANITVNGVLTDYYEDFTNARNNAVNKYDFTVMMDEGKWYGAWNVQGSKNVIANNYRKGKDIVDTSAFQGTGNVKVSGHPMEELYIDKDNNVASKVIKDYISQITLWENQHLWNHLSQLASSPDWATKRFTYDAENMVYEYTLDVTDVDDLYFMTYLSFSLTPMLSDTLEKIWLVVEDGEITKLIAQTEILYDGGETTSAEDAAFMSYTTFEITFSDIGTTEVPEPAKYTISDSAKQYYDLLEKALKEMREASGYTFKAVETTTYAPSYDSGDYEIDGGATSGGTMQTMATHSSVYNYRHSSGKDGIEGLVTSDAVLLATTGHYLYGLDEDLYFTEYSGYKQNDDNTYDYFEFSAYAYEDGGAMVGKKKTAGNISDVLPKFQFSPALFRMVSAMPNEDDVIVYTFTLSEVAVTRDIAMQVSMHNYATSAAASATQRLTIVVDEDGHLISTTFPYNITFGTYMGYVTTTYSKINKTEIDEGVFTDYIPRVWSNDWADYTMKYFSADYSTLTSHEVSADVAIDVIAEGTTDYKENLPTPQFLLDIFGDNFYGPFYDWDQKGTDANGNPIYTSYFSVTAQSSGYDENRQITNYDELMEKIDETLKAMGFTYSRGNSDTSGGETGRSNRYVCYIKGDVQIVIENNFTSYFWIYFYVTGSWTLR